MKLSQILPVNVRYPNDRKLFHHFLMYASRLPGYLLIHFPCQLLRLSSKGAVFRGFPWLHLTLRFLHGRTCPVFLGFPRLHLARRSDQLILHPRVPLVLRGLLVQLRRFLRGHRARTIRVPLSFLAHRACRLLGFPSFPARPRRSINHGPTFRLHLLQCRFNLP